MSFFTISIERKNEGQEEEYPTAVCLIIVKLENFKPNKISSCKTLSIKEYRLPILVNKIDAKKKDKTIFCK